MIVTENRRSAAQNLVMINSVRRIISLVSLRSLSTKFLHLLELLLYVMFISEESL